MISSAEPASSSSRHRFLQLARWALALLLLTSYPLAALLPEEFGWENGWIENVQVALLLAGFAHAAWVLRGLRAAAPPGGHAGNDPTLRRLCLLAMPLWLLCAARETSWGATFLTPGIMAPDGPFYSSSLLWYHPAIKPFVLAVVALEAVAFVRWRLDRPLLALARQRRLPWIEFALVVFAGVVSSTAEGNFAVILPGSEGTRMVLEEWAETLCYLGLWLAQARLFFELRRRPAAF
jgi:hypothetical protein